MLRPPAHFFLLSGAFLLARFSVAVCPALTIQEDFSLDKNGVAPADGTVVYSLFSRWGATGVNDPGQTLTVSVNAPANAFTPSSDRALFYDDNTDSGADNLRLQLQNNTGGAVEPFTDEVTTLSFDYHNVANAQTMILLVGDAGGLNRLALNLFKPAGNVGQVYNGNQFIAATDGGNNWLDRNTWYRFTLAINNQADTYDLKIEEAGNPVPRYDVSGLNIQNTSGVDQDLGTITRVEFTPFGNATGIGHEAYFDNVSITQPVPVATGPNILFIICDDLNDSVEGFGGHPQAYTPNIDSLASQGVKFLNAACNAPLCAPSRPSMLTGMYPHTTKYIGNPDQTATNQAGEAVYKEAWDHTVFIDSKTWVQYFKENGYDVYGAGKIDHNFAERESDWTEEGQVIYGPKPSWGPFPYKGTGVRTTGSTDSINGIDGMNFQLAAPHSSMPKFKHLSYFVPLSDVPTTPAYPGPPPGGGWPNHSTEKYYESFLADGFAGYTGWYLYNAPYAYVDETNRDPMPDELLAEYAEDFFAARSASGETKPFFMNIGINRPHEPWVAPDEYFDLFPLETILTFPLADSPLNDLEDCAPFLYENFDTGNTTWVGGFGKYKSTIGADGSGDEDLMKQWTQAYLACVAFADAMVGRILDALDDPNGDGDTSDSMAANTIVVLTSDHGYHMGEKLYKFKNSAWEEGVRVPFVVAGPGVAVNQECSKPVSLIDLFPTFIELAGLTEATPPPQSLDGHSIVPFLTNPVNGSWAGPDVSLTALATSNLGNTGFTDPTIISTVGVSEGHIYSVRSEQYRYIICPDGSSELYDMMADPYAYTNRTDDLSLASVKQTLHEKAEALVGRPLGVFFKATSYEPGYPAPQWYIDYGLSGLTDMTADIYGSGLPLLGVYALGLDPGASIPLAVPATDGSGVDLRFFASAPGIDYTVLQSNDLLTWTPAGIDGLPTDGEGYKTLHFPINGPPWVFYRFGFGLQ